MRKLKIFIYLNLVIFFLSSCGTIKQGFSNQKKNSSDEFLVEKKSSLVMPPNFNELPIPNMENEDTSLKKDGIKKLISNKDVTQEINNTNSNLEGSIFDKIKSN